MLSKGFKIGTPKTFEIDIESIENESGKAIIKVDYMAICKADLRYYLGNRDKKILGLKYPMRLIHEATGTVLKDINSVFKSGDKVVLIPNICDCAKCDFKYKALGVNYCPKAKFASSNYDGFSSECISYSIENIVKYNDNISGSVAVFSELISVAIAAVRRVEIKDDYSIGIWGDGILGYILANVIKFTTKSNVIVFGKNKSKLDKFDVDDVRLIDDDINDIELDVAFECVGGNFSGSAINQMIETVKFGGEIILTGVSENGATINTRRILEKATRITGTTRSTIEDFKLAVKLLENKDFCNKIEKLILSINEVNDINIYYDIFKTESENRELGKNIMKLNL
jgi:ribitol-5-phosphate 2-dehydrogenase